MKTKLYLAGILVAMLCLAGCNNYEAPAIILDVTEINAPVLGGEYIVNVTCKGDWTATTEKRSWLSVSPTKGIGNTEVKITVTATKWEADDATTVVFASGEDMVELTINRKGLGEKKIMVSEKEINAPKEGGEFTLEVNSSAIWSVSSNVSWITYNPGVSKNKGKITVIIQASQVPEVTKGVLTIAEYGNSANNKVDVVVTREASTGELSGKFSVSADKRVQFSQGNLQYQASSRTWRFAENQYDMIGVDNENISNSYSGWIDLFGWGTGNNPTNTSEDNADYPTFTDWGVNKIYNGGNKAKQWRTLTKDEWEYLLSGRYKADELRSQASVKNDYRDIHGYILLPDSLSLPSELSFIANAEDWSTNRYSLSDWQKLEKLGAVFLPAAGWRFGTTIMSVTVGSYGQYMSSTSYEDDYYYAWSLEFEGKSAITSKSYRYYGQSVRLVKDVK